MKKEMPWDAWFAEAKNIKCPEQLRDFADKLFVSTEHTYDSAVHAVSALALAGANLGAHMEGITGFQAGFVKFDFLKHWDGYGKLTGCMNIIDYDQLLYPQHLHEYRGLHISKCAWKCIQRACADKLNALDTPSEWEGKRHAYWSVREYWGKVCSGWIPKELSVRNDNDQIVPFVAPICVTRPTHTLADVETAWDDRTSPYYDEERHQKKYEEWLKEQEKECNCAG